MRRWPKQRIEKFVKGDGALRSRLREAVNGPAEEMEQRLREIIPPALGPLFPDEVQKKKLQASLEERMRGD